jgi:predicted PilT family ATPase
VGSTRVIKSGIPVRALRFRYVTPGQIVVTQDGANFNGQNSASHRFFVDIYKEDEFIFSAMVGNNGRIRVKKKSSLGKAVLQALAANRLKIYGKN